MAPQIDADAANIPNINMVVQGSAPAAPTTGHVRIYVEDGALYLRFDTGDPIAVGGLPGLAQGQLAIGDGDDQLTELALGTEGYVVTADASGFATWAAPTGGDGGGGDGHVTILPWAYSGYTGTVPILQASSSQIGGGWLYNSTGAQNDQIAWKVALAPGTYTLHALGIKQNNQGILTFALDSTELGTWDQYSAGAVYGQVFSITGIVVATQAVRTLTCTVASKNASSSGYRYYLTSISLYRTA